MHRALLCLAWMMATGPAFAATDTWTAQIQDDEGGSVMVASVTAAAVGDVTPELFLMCAGSEGLNLRYVSSADTVAEGTEADFSFENENSKLTKHMKLEEMDGAFAAYFQPSDPMVAFLQTGDEVFISESSGNYPAQTFTLSGSSKAIGKLLKTCKK